MSEAIATPGNAVPGVPARGVSGQSAVSWAAVFAGGVTAAALAVILTVLGAGLGLAAVSPWPGHGVSTVGFTAIAAVWLIVVQWVASFFGGFMAGRLRTKWVDVHSDEVTFRDTAHGFLAWSIALLITLGTLAGIGSGATGVGGKLAAKALDTGVAQNYYLSELFRPVPDNGNLSGISLPGATPQELRTDAGAVLAQGVVSGGMAQTDKDYLATLVSASTGLDRASAQARVNDVLNREQAEIAKAKQVADAARKSASAAAVYTFFSGLVGAFIAAVAGAIGGRIRDRY